MKLSVAVIVAVAALTQSNTADAGVYQDDFVRCLVAKTTQDDRRAFVRWMFTSMSANADIQDLSIVTEAERTEATKATAQLVQRLIFSDCRAEGVTAVRYEGQGSFVVGFEMVGRVAMRDLMADPAVSANMSRLDEFLDRTAMEEFVGDVGLTSPSENK